MAVRAQAGQRGNQPTERMKGLTRALEALNTVGPTGRIVLRCPCPSLTSRVSVCVWMQQNGRRPSSRGYAAGSTPRSSVADFGSSSSYVRAHSIHSSVGSAALTVCGLPPSLPASRAAGRHPSLLRPVLHLVPASHPCCLILSTPIGRARRQPHVCCQVCLLHGRPAFWSKPPYCPACAHQLAAPACLFVCAWQQVPWLPAISRQAKRWPYCTQGQRGGASEAEDHGEGRGVLRRHQGAGQVRGAGREANRGRWARSQSALY